MMKTKIIITIFLAIFGMAGHMMAQKTISKGKGTNDFPELIYADIKGAPKLGKPTLVLSESKPVFAAGMGWVAPTMWDWDGDGKKDMLIGEFGTGVENGKPIGNFIRVYKNIGTNTSPKFKDDFFYAAYAEDENISLRGNNDEIKYPKHLVNYGTPISIPQFCCMAFKPQFIDLNGDGYEDLYAGRYTPGEVYWFRGSDLGFLPGEKLHQKGDASARKGLKPDSADPNNWSYWSYSAVSFGEFTGDALPDMIVGGDGLRISKNIGTKTNPEVGYREVLLDMEGKPLWDKKYGTSIIPYVVDWDQDGILDILVSNSYGSPGNQTVVFFKGREKGKPLFEKGVPLFTAKNDGKAFPGEYLNISVTDWNNDGINDLLIGTKVAVLNGTFDHQLNWIWELGMSLTMKSNPGYLSAQKIKEIDEEIKSVALREMKLKKELGLAEFLKRKEESNTSADMEKYKTREDLLKRYYGGTEKYKSLIHQGYVYVMLGNK